MLKTASNEKDKQPIWLMQCNNLNLPLLANNLDKTGNLANVHDRKYQAEKGIQPMKNSFTSKKGKFAANSMEKLCTNKILNQFADNNESDIASKCKLSNYHLKSCGFLNEKLKRGLPAPFVLNDIKDCLFLLNNGPAQQFVLANHVIKLMGLNYFHLKHVKNTKSPDSLLK